MSRSLSQLAEWSQEGGQRRGLPTARVAGDLWRSLSVACEPGAVAAVQGIIFKSLACSVLSRRCL